MARVIIPAAGLGTRFAPYTSFVPKELLPVLNKPALSYILEECFQAALHEIVVITHSRKPLIAEFLSQQKNYSFFYVEQPEPRGLGHAILCGESLITESSFGICLPDDIVLEDSVIGQLQKLSHEHNASILAVQPVTPDKLSAYGVVGIKQHITHNLFELNSIIEKPQPHQAPSCFGIIGRYWLHKDIFNALKMCTPDIRNEIQLTDGIKYLIENGHKVLAYVVPQQRYDIGTPDGWLQANNAIRQHINMRTL